MLLHRRLVASLLAASALLGCAALPKPTDPLPEPSPTSAASPEVQNPALRQELLAIQEADQAARTFDHAGESPSPTALARMAEVDTANQARLKQIVQHTGGRLGAWLGKKVYSRPF